MGPRPRENDSSFEMIDVRLEPPRLPMQAAKKPQAGPRCLRDGPKWIQGGRTWLLKRPNMPLNAT
eukprot:9390179-Pyramimonas_sp.AAC.1